MGTLSCDEHVLLSQNHCQVYTAGNNDTFADSGHNPSNDIHGCVGSWISNDHEEGFFGTLAETASINGYLNVSIFTNELDACIEAPNHAPCVANACFNNWIISSSLLVFLCKVFEQYFDHSDNGNEQRSKSQ